MERGDTGLGRDAYGPPRRRRLGDRRAYRLDDGAGPNGADGAEDDEYGQLLRRPGDLPPQPGPYQPGRSRMRPPPGRFPPPGGNPADGFPPNGGPGNGGPANGDSRNGGSMNGGPMNGSPMNGSTANGGPMPGRHYRLPNGRRVPPRADRPYRQQAPGAAGGMRGTWNQPGPGQAPGPSGQDPLSADWARPPRPQAPAGPPPRADGGPYGYGNAPGPPGTHGAAGFTGNSGAPGFTGASGPSGASQFAGASGPSGASQYPGAAGPSGTSQFTGAAGASGASQFTGGAGASGASQFTGGAGFAGNQADPRADGHEGWGRLGTPAPRGVPAGTTGQVIRQRENGVPEERPVAAAQSAVSIAPDGLESFARDLRALRSKAELDYPQMAETSHYTMKTLASAAGGLRLPTLPVAVAYVRACGGNVAEWEERWQKLATKITSDAGKKRRGDSEERRALPEPADRPALPEPPAPSAAQDSPAEPGEVYVITSAKLPRGVWGDGSPQEQGGFGGDRSPRS